MMSGHGANPVFLINKKEKLESFYKKNFSHKNFYIFLRRIFIRKWTLKKPKSYENNLRYQIYNF